MDYFSVLFESVCLLAQSAIQLIFMSRLLGKKYRIWCFVLYPGVLFVLGFALANKICLCLNRKRLEFFRNKHENRRI